MRGEDSFRDSLTDTPAGSPPHARGRLDPPSLFSSDDGITPACAGKTRIEFDVAGVHADHPRMRGEDTSATRTKYPENGSPPHARGRRHRLGDEIVNAGITPACAGKTSASEKWLSIA